MVAVALFNALHSFPKTTKPFVNYCDKLTELIIKISFGINSTPAVTSKVVYPGWTLTINSLIYLIVNMTVKDGESFQTIKSDGDKQYSLRNFSEAINKYSTYIQSNTSAGNIEIALVYSNRCACYLQQGKV